MANLQVSADGAAREARAENSDVSLAGDPLKGQLNHLELRASEQQLLRDCGVDRP